MRHWTITILFLVLLSSGCASPRTSTIEVSPADLPYETTPMYHTVYVGSDSTHHYFELGGMKTGGTDYYKVSVSQMTLAKTFPLDSGEPPEVLFRIWNPPQRNPR
ncbi:MAG: hypothetical protein H7210_13875 [Pyrinomonadaceae bacterium]|nr:hypothetical protein [Phycisphaerales bacterium]